MFIWFVRLLVIIASPIIGYLQVSSDAKGILVGVGVGLVLILIEIVVEKISLGSIIAATIGIVIGLIFAKLLEYTVFLMDDIRVTAFFETYSLLIKIMLAYTGFIIALRKKEELDILDKDIVFSDKGKKGKNFKILDTSAIIDGRIADIIETRFLGGVLIVPQFVLDELQNIADASDPLRRAKGRRGLDILDRLQKEQFLPIKIYEGDYSEIDEVDKKLLKLAEDLNSEIITTDYNLNKVAKLHGIMVLNVNDLSNALKPIFLPGERMNMFIVKEGKERKQGIAYLDDGTMVVVEDGKNFIGKRVAIVVTTILQTPAGRMIFAKFISEENSNISKNNNRKRNDNGEK
ncbi:hypothetical protein KAI68_06735 [bacterium]|nr:hypothetical protein [bacterium]